MYRDDGESTASPDEIVRLLDLSAAQLEASIGEAEEPVQRLTEAFFSLSQLAADALDALGSGSVEGRDRHGALLERWATAQQQMQAAVEAFQFHDRLCQRIGHVRDGLSQIAGLVSDADAASRRSAWQELHGSLRRRYTIDHERVMFDLLVDGRTEDALLPASNAANSVELF